MDVCTVYISRENPLPEPLVYISFNSPYLPGVNLKHSVEPNRMEYHMKDVVLNWPTVPKEMLLYLLDPHLHPPVSSLRDREEYVLQVWDILLQYKNGKGFPVQSLEKRGHEIVGYDHGHALVEDGFHNSRTVYFITFRTYAVLATSHVLNVVHITLVVGHGTEYPHVRIFVGPVL